MSISLPLPLPLPSTTATATATATTTASAGGAGGAVEALHFLALSALPLRPSTLTLLQQRGFETVGELLDSKGSGMATLAAELQVELPHASRLLREVQECIGGGNCNRSGGSDSSGDKEKEKENGIQQEPNASNDFLMSWSTPPLSTADELLQQHKPPKSKRKRHSSSHTSLSDGSSSRLLQQQQQQQHIVTFCQPLDALLRGGIPLGAVTELAGLPGVGKTQLAQQLAVNARLPLSLGGVQGQTLYVDAEGSLAPERLDAMAQALMRHARATLHRRHHKQVQLQEKQATSNSNSTTTAAPAPTTTSTSTELPPDFCQATQILDHIHCFRVHDEASQTATLYSLPHWIDQYNQQHPDIPVRLVVVDSIAFHYRAAAATSTATASSTTSTPTSGSATHGGGRSSNRGGGAPPHPQHNPDFYSQRSQALTQLAAHLGQVARQYQVAVVCINQMTTKLVGGGNSRLVPALGESWAHATTHRLLLSSSSSSGGGGDDGDDDRMCTLVKSPNLPSGTASYQVTSEGIRRVSSMAAVVVVANDAGG